MNVCYLGKHLRDVLVSNRGETMVETLVSVLISALALLMLSTAIGTAVNIVRNSRDYMKQYYEAERVAIDAYAGSGGSEGSVALSVPLVNTGDTSIKVRIDENDEGIVMYKEWMP